MKLAEIPTNTVVELHFFYMGIRMKVSVGLLYKYADIVYISALKSAGKTVPASQLRSVNLIYRSEAGIYTFHSVALRSLSLQGQKLYAVTSQQEAQEVNHRQSYRIYLGINIMAKVVTENDEEELQCILKDISATGMGILSRKKVEESARIEVSFSLHNVKEKLIGYIARIDEFKNGTGFLYGCEFTKPNETIGKYIATKVEKLTNNDVRPRAERSM
jgi:c-di-GMP-binding flagellar brake protein YcgR